MFYNEKMPFQAIKTRRLNSLKSDIFLKWLTHGFGPKMAISRTFCFQAIQPRKMSFTIFQNEKMPFQAIKTRSLNSLTSDIFLKQLTHGFGPKMAIFPTFFLQARQTNKIFFTIFQNEKMPVQAIKTRSEKSRKINIFVKGLTHGFWYKNGHLSKFFFQAIQTTKMSFTIFQKKKMPVQTINSRRSKSRKIDIFLKGLTHALGPKMAISRTIFFQAIQPRKMSFTIFQNEKMPFLAIKTRS